MAVGEFIVGERRVTAWGRRPEGKGLSLAQEWQCFTLPSPTPRPSRHWQASLIILPSLDEVLESFSKQPGQGATVNVLGWAGKMNLFTMPGIEHVLGGSWEGRHGGVIKGAGETRPSGAGASQSRCELWPQLRKTSGPGAQDDLSAVSVRLR